MSVSQSPFRETAAASSPNPHNTDRYLASDFSKLTNRVPRRLTTPASTPAFTPDSVQSKPSGSSTSATPAAVAPSNSPLATPDKRALTSAPFARTQNSSTKLDSSRGSSPTKCTRQTSRSNSTGRTSPAPLDFCVKEDSSGIAQSFLESVNASIAPKHDPLALPASPILDGIGPLDSGACECCCKCGKATKVQHPARKLGRRSKSYTSLRTGISELSGWDLDLPRRQDTRPVEKKQYAKGEAPLEKLPTEVLDDVIAQLALDLPPASYGPRNVDLVNCLLTSKTVHVATINTLYRNITVPHSAIFSKFLSHISEYPGLGTLVRRLDLSHFTSVGLGRSRQTNAEIQNLTPRTLVKCLELTPWIQEILLQENLDDDIDATVLQKMFFDLPKLRAVDFCAASSHPFVSSFTATMRILSENPSTMIGIKRLSLHECFTLPGTAFGTLLPRLTQLTHLEVSHTRITDAALASLPASAQLTHLNLGRCTQISGEGVVDFLVNHPAVKKLVYLNLSCDISRYRLLWEADIDRLLPALPSTLRSLNLNGAHIHPHHLKLLLPLTKHLEELGLAAANLSLTDVNSLFRPALDDGESENQGQPSDKGGARTGAAKGWVPSTVHYLDLTSISAITQSKLFHTPPPGNVLLTPSTLPLEVIELGDKVISSLRECRNTNKRLGWCVKELGRRGWYVREPINGGASTTGVDGNDGEQNGGRRAWKMGAMWWGMRKCPVAWGEVGGLYGHYMFKK